MKKLGAALILSFGLASAALAQNFNMPPPAGVQVGGFIVVASCGAQSLTVSGPPAFGTMDQTGKLCTAASVSASISGFRPVSHGTPVAATTGGNTQTLPTNTGEVVATNVGTTNGAYCALGASATTSDQYIAPNGGWFGFAISGDTQITCLTSTSTTTVNTVGGSGVPTGTGGGGGGGGSSGAVFGPTAVGSANANPPVVIGGTATGAAGQNVEGVAVKPASTAAVATDLSLVTNESPNSQLSTAAGTTADSAYAGSGSASIVAALKGIYAVANSAATFASQYPSGAVPLTASATGTTAATTATLAGTTGKTTYICGYSIRANATANTNVTDTITGVISGTMSSALWVPANTAGLGVDEQIFTPCIPASATNTGIAAVSGAPGAGGVVTVKAWGYQL